MSKVKAEDNVWRFESNDLGALDTAYRVSAYPRDWGNADVSGGEDVLITDLHVDGDDYNDSHTSTTLKLQAGTTF